MGFFFRKSVKAGPVRLNFFKSGLGASIGVKDFRVGAAITLYAGLRRDALLPRLREQGEGASQGSFQQC